MRNPPSTQIVTHFLVLRKCDYWGAKRYITYCLHFISYYKIRIGGGVYEFRGFFRNLRLDENVREIINRWTERLPVTRKIEQFLTTADPNICTVLYKNEGFNF